MTSSFPKGYAVVVCIRLLHFISLNIVKRSEKKKQRCRLSTHMCVFMCASINIEKVNKEVQGGSERNGMNISDCVTCQEMKCLKHEWLQTPINNKYRIPFDSLSLCLSLSLSSLSAYTLICLLYSICMHVRVYVWVCVLWKNSHCFVCAHLILFLLLVYLPYTH